MHIHVENYNPTRINILVNLYETPYKTTHDLKFLRTVLRFDRTIGITTLWQNNGPATS